MVNLAGDKNCDEVIRQELSAAKIPIIELGASMNREVPASTIGFLNGFRFIRAWRYWMVFGAMPLGHAKYIYQNYKDLDIRCAGHCCNPPPEEWCEPLDYNERCRPFFEKYLKNEITSEQFIEMGRNIRNQGAQYVKNYHVDTQEGLCKLAETIMKVGIVSAT